MSTEREPTLVPTSVRRGAAGYSLVLSRTSTRAPEPRELMFALIHASLIVLAMATMLLPAVLGVPTVRGAAAVAYYGLSFGVIALGALGAFLLVRKILELGGGGMNTRITLDGEGFVLERRQDLPLRVAWCAVRSARYLRTGRPAIELVVGWPDATGELRSHRLTIPFDAEEAAALWLVQSIETWRQNTEVVVHRAPVIPEWVQRPETAPRDLAVKREGEAVHVDFGTALRDLQDPSLRVTIAVLCALPLAVPAIGLPIWLSMPNVEKHHLIPALGIAVAAAGVLLLLSCIALGWLALYSVRVRLTMDEEHLTLPATEDRGEIRVPWDAILSSELEVIQADDITLSSLKVRLDPVSAPIIPRRDDQGRGVVTLGRGLPTDQLSWINNELERRRARASTTPRSPRVGIRSVNTQQPSYQPPIGASADELGSFGED